MGYNTEITNCDGCGKIQSVEVVKYYYSINCSCCQGKIHNEIVKYCSSCDVVPPPSIKVNTKPFKRI